MPKAFSENERDLLYARLLDIGEECWGKYGVKRANIEEITQLAGIAKGTFYLFFETKELFFLHVLERGQAKINERMSEILQDETKDKKEQFVHSISELYREIKNYKWLVRFLSDDTEYEYLIRKLPSNTMNQANENGFDEAAYLMEQFQIASDICPKAFASSLRALFYLLMHEKEIGEDDSLVAFQLLLEGLSLRIYTEI